MTSPYFVYLTTKLNKMNLNEQDLRIIMWLLLNFWDLVAKILKLDGFVFVSLFFQRIYILLIV